MKSMKKVLILFLCMALLGFAGCRDNHWSDYRTRPFGAELRWESCGVLVSCEIRANQKNGGVLSLDAAHFSAPPHLAGMTVRRAENGVLVQKNGLALSSRGAEGWLQAAELLCSEGACSFCCRTEVFGVEMGYAQLRQGSNVVEVYLSAQTGYPQKVCGNGYEVTVIRFFYTDT